MTRAYWYRGTRGFDRGNFGDALTVVLFARLAGIRLEWAPPQHAELFGIGSIAGRIPPGFRGVVFGTGKMHARTELDLSTARVLALRGPLTAELANTTCDLLADPGLLAAELAPAVERDVPLGLIRHYVDRRRLPGLPIDVLAGVDRVIAAAARCERIASSSLHGLILADALGIPNRWLPHEGVVGDGFKFRDYAASFGERIEPGEWRLAEQGQVAAKRAALLAALRSLAQPATVAS